MVEYNRAMKFGRVSLRPRDVAAAYQWYPLIAEHLNLVRSYLKKFLRLVNLFAKAPEGRGFNPNL